MAEKKVYLSLGSNVGDREKNLRAAIAAVEDGLVRVKKISSFYETEPVDLREQRWFLNCVLEGETKIPARELLRSLRGIETQMGSTKLVAKGPRLIDMDILLYGNDLTDTPELQVPHPRMHLRKFVLIPLVEIAPNVRHPSWKGTAADLLAEAVDSSVVRKFESSR